MKHLLDTCVLSEARHDSGDPGVRAALEELSAEEAYLASITITELAKGIAKLSTGRRKTGLSHWYGALIAQYADRIIAFDTAIAEEAGKLAAEAERRGMPVPLADTIIGATARRHGLVVMTRNVRHFQMLGVPFFNPWSRA